MPPLLRLACARSFRPLHTLLRIHTEDQPERHLIAVRQLHNHIRDLARIAFRTSFEAPQQLDHRTDRGFIVRQQIRRILPCAARPVGPNAAWLQRADLDPERRDLHRQSVAETAHRPLCRVIWRIAAVRDAATDRRHLKDVTAPLLAHYRYSGARRVNHAVEARVHDRLEVLCAYLLEWRNQPIARIVDQHIHPPEGVHRYLYGSLCRGLVAHFERNGLHPLTVLRHERRQFLRSTRSGYHAVTCRQRRLGDVPPQPVSASRNQPCSLCHFLVLS